MVGWSVGQLVSRSSNYFDNSESRFGDYVAIVCTLINTLLIIVLYRHGIKCVITKVKYIVDFKDRVLVPWGPSSISAVAELVLSRNKKFEGPFSSGNLVFRLMLP